MPAAASQPVHVLCRYLVKPGREAAFLEVLQRHWETVHAAGLTSDRPARLIRAEDTAGHRAFIEIFSWKDQAAIDRAHQDARVMALWEPMGALCESMEFWHGQVVKGPSVWE